VSTRILSERNSMPYYSCRSQVKEGWIDCKSLFLGSAAGLFFNFELFLCEAIWADFSF